MPTPQTAAPADAAPSTPALKGTKEGVDQAQVEMVAAQAALNTKMQPGAPTDGKSKEELQKELMEAARIYALEHYLALKSDLNYTETDADAFTKYQKSLEAQAKDSAAPPNDKAAADNILEGMKKGEEESNKKKEVSEGTIRFTVGHTQSGKPCINIDGKDIAAAKEFLEKKFKDSTPKFKVKIGKDGQEKWKIPPAPPSMSEIMAEMKQHLETEKKLKVEMPTEKEMQKFSTLPGAIPEPTSAAPRM